MGVLVSRAASVRTLMASPSTSSWGRGEGVSVSVRYPVSQGGVKQLPIRPPDRRGHRSQVGLRGQGTQTGLAPQAKILSAHADAAGELGIADPVGVLVLVDQANERRSCHPTSRAKRARHVKCYFPRASSDT